LRLRREAAQRLTEHLQAQQNKVFDVLMEREGLGRTPGFTEIEIPDCSLVQGAIVRARVTGLTNNHLTGECVAS
jgi:threonylcarbamoyladenosine tRNA methylthiotransferase MtaB